MTFSNAQKLSAVVSEWVRPAVAQIASSKLMELPMMQNLSAAIGGSGLVGQGYTLATDLEPLIIPVVSALVEPMLTQYISNLPDDAIPQVARNIVEQMKVQGTVTLLDGLITLEDGDIAELDALLEKNLPIESADKYEVIH